MKEKRLGSGMIRLSLRAGDAAVDDVEVGSEIDAVFGHLDSAVDRVAVIAEGASEALRKRRAVSPELPFMSIDGHMHDAADDPLVRIELVVRAVGTVAADDRGVVG